MEKVAREYILYPSNNPGKILFFHTREEAISFAARHYATCEIDVPVPTILPLEVAYEIANTFCQQNPAQI
jgi:hypothetical protein